MKAVERALRQVEIPGRKPDYAGKVRDIYELGDSLLIVATDRVSAYDVVLGEGVPGKGRVLTQISRFWFEKLRDIVPNHYISTEAASFPAPFGQHAALLEGRSMLVRRAKRYGPVPTGCAPKSMPYASTVSRATAAVAVIART